VKNVEVNPAGELCCPLCGGSNTHIDETFVAGSYVEAVRVPTGQVVARGDHCGVSIERVTSASLLGWCESCGGKFELRFATDKGVTLVEAVALPGKIDGWLDPEPVPLIKAIETWYAGCRFRSRLEARWAVFFDQAGIEWQYEPQGYEIGPPDDRRRYLPDFWLPTPGIWVEVKGKLTLADQRTLFHAAVPGSGLPNVEYGLLLLGDVPHVKPGWRCDHFVLRRCEDDGHGPGPSLHLCGAQWRGWDAQLTVGDPHPGAHIVLDSDGLAPWSWCLQASVSPNSEGPGLPLFSWGEWAVTPRVAAAYAAARSARFEHGEKG
jgi:hypothetical protein